MINSSTDQGECAVRGSGAKAEACSAQAKRRSNGRAQLSAPRVTSPLRGRAEWVAKVYVLSL
eukprot:8201004-Heterocapsa_arctica.AAC.1